jgi:hypothetical protein
LKTTDFPNPAGCYWSLKLPAAARILVRFTTLENEMIIDERPTVRTGAIPRTWVPVPAPPRPPQEEREDAARLKQLSLLCANSYDSRKKKREAVEYFLTDSELNYATHRRAFGPSSGQRFWRPLAFVLMPFNYLVIWFWFLVLIVPLIAIGFFTEALLEYNVGWSSHFFTWILASSPIWLYRLTLGVAGLGLLVGAVIAFAPWLASGRAFGLVDPTTSRAIVIVRGSEKYHNLTINALVWPYFFPLRHLGFHRAWDHIRPEVRQWLKDVVSEGKAKEIVFTGHSLGGALAQIAAFDLAGEFAISHVVSLGSACIGGRGMRRRFAAREVAGGGRLNARHFTYTLDMMPRIPPSSIFCQVGRRFRLPESGGPVEGIESGLLKSSWDYFVNTMSFFGTHFMTMATKIKRAIRRLLNLPSKQESRMTFHELVNDFSNVVQTFPYLILPVLFAGTIAVVTFPFIFVATLYWYYFVMFRTGLSAQHAVSNYRDAFQRYSP